MLHRFGIAGRVAALLVVGVALSTGTLAWILYRTGRQAERAALEGRAEALSRIVASSLQETASQGHPGNLQPVLDALARTGGVAGLSIADSRGTTRLDAGEHPASLAVGDDLLAWTGQRLTLTRPVANGPSCMRCHGGSQPWNGALQVSLDASALESRLHGAAVRMGLVAALAIGATSIAALLIRRTLARRLDRLNAFGEALRRGEFWTRPPPAPWPEADAITSALSRMAEEVKRSHGELEARVRERTAKLAEALSAANAAREERAVALTRLQAIVDSMPDGVLFVDAQDQVALVNHAGSALRNLNGRTGQNIRTCHPAHHLATLERVLAYLRQGDDAGPPHSIIKERGGRYETTYAPVRAPGGEYLGIVMVMRDIADRRSLERRLLDAERLAGLGQMSAQLAHELRNPLNAIDGAAQYLRRVLPEHPEVAEYSALIGDEVQRVNRFIGELLHVARPAEPAFAASTVNKLAREAAQRVVLARGEGVAAPSLHLAPGLPVLDLDQPMVLEALVNLLQNAYESGGPEPPEIATRFEGSGGEGRVVVEVRDRGCGIPADQLDEVTRPFVTTKTEGTGLGLVVVTRAAEQHRARFLLSAREGGGTVATLHFPVRTRAPAPVERMTS